MGKKGEKTNPRSRKISNSEATQGPRCMIYVRKPSAADSTKVSSQPMTQQAFMQQLFNSLKPHADVPTTTSAGASAHKPSNVCTNVIEDHEADEEYRKIVSRKVSMNEQNVIGMNFEKYNLLSDAKPTHNVKRKVANFAVEYQETKDRDHARASFLELCLETLDIPRYYFVGYILNNAFSLDHLGWIDFQNLIIDYLYSQDGLLTGKDLLEG
jgi:hypothetical protein